MSWEEFIERRYPPHCAFGESPGAPEWCPLRTAPAVVELPADPLQKSPEKSVTLTPEQLAAIREESRVIGREMDRRIRPMLRMSGEDMRRRCR